MRLPIVTEISAICAHRQADLVRWSLMAVPENRVPRGEADPRDPLRRADAATFRPRPRETA
jgi:hypothetical protein